MIDLKTYGDDKPNNLVAILKTDSGSYAVATKKWDAKTGSQLPDEVVGVDLAEYRDKIVTLQTEIAQIESFIIDCEKIV